jgi:hypothetical protein
VGDKSYSSRHIRHWLRQHGIRHTIPHKHNECQRGPFDRGVYRDRNRAERLINRPKQHRRITDQDTLERLASVWATKWDGSWPYQVRDGSFYLYDEDEQRVLVESSPVFSVKPTKIFAFVIGINQTRHQF